MDKYYWHNFAFSNEYTLFLDMVVMKMGPANLLYQTSLFFNSNFNQECYIPF